MVVADPRIRRRGNCAAMLREPSDIEPACRGDADADDLGRRRSWVDLFPCDRLECCIYRSAGRGVIERRLPAQLPSLCRSDLPLLHGFPNAPTAEGGGFPV